ncbi:MAG: acyl-CoA dehydrogenase family protein, partial [Actinomycetota bacterium]|nr:acyl-CoA dehydrogenase family protein [Actinomycetota bacterium]
MINGMLNDELCALQSVVRDFANDAIAPVIGQHYEECTFPYELVKGMGELGLFGLPFPEEYGGSGGDYFALCLALEEIARVDSSVAITLEAAVSLGAMPVYRFGTEEQKRQWLPRLCSGELLGAFGLTEPEVGSGVAGGLATSARRDGDMWILNGRKTWIGNATFADLVIIWARDEADGQVKGFVVEKDMPGF